MKKINQVEPKEQVCADASGAFEAPAFNITKREIYKIHNSKPKEEKEGEFTEATDSSSSGAYDAPFGDGGKDPLKINGPDSIKNSRAVKDKNFPKWGGPGGVFIKIKDKCKTFPYCNQGDINAIEVLREAINETAKKYGLPNEEVENIVLKEIKDIFI